MSTSATPRGLLFGTAAESYERFRPGYPDEVVDRTLHFAGHPVTSAVEVGAGTGKATRAFASRGVRVTALEPDREMFSVLQRETLGMPVNPVMSTFEAYDGPPTDLVYAAASLHWTDPKTRWTHAADLLAEDGVMAVFGFPLQISDAQVEATVADAIRLVVDDVATDGEDEEPPHEPGDLGDELQASHLFTDVEAHSLAREVLVPQKEYIGYLSTLSAYLRLPPDERLHVLRGVVRVLPAQVPLDLTVRLHLARRA